MLRRINRETDPQRRVTPLDFGGGGSGDCPEVHALSLPGLLEDNAGNVRITYTITRNNTTATNDVLVDVRATAQEVASALIAGHPMIHAGEVKGSGGPLPSEVYITFRGGLSARPIALPIVVFVGTGVLRPVPIVRRASSALDYEDPA